MTDELEYYMLATPRERAIFMYAHPDLVDKLKLKDPKELENLLKEPEELRKHKHRVPFVTVY